MKTLIVLLFSGLVATAAPPLVNFTVIWQDTNTIPALDHYVPKTNNCYVLVGTNNLSAPIATWPVLATYTSWTLGTNAGQIWYTNSVNLPPNSNWFISIVCSNFWGFTAPFSNVDQTGPVPSSTVNLSLGR